MSISLRRREFIAGLGGATASRNPHERRNRRDARSLLLRGGVLVRGRQGWASN
jgi:hypothetical protein